MASPRRAHCTGARRRGLCERATATRPCNGCTTCSEFSFSLVKLAPGITATVTVHGRRIVGERSLCRRLRMVLDSLQDCPWKACMSSDHTLQPVSPTRDVRENTKRSDRARRQRRMQPARPVPSRFHSGRHLHTAGRACVRDDASRGLDRWLSHPMQQESPPFPSFLLPCCARYLHLRAAMTRGIRACSRLHLIMSILQAGFPFARPGRSRRGERGRRIVWPCACMQFWV